MATSQAQATRTEKDSLGTKEIPAAVYYGIQTARALGYPGLAFAAEETRAIFVRLGEVEGLVGVVARFALQRGDLDVLVEKVPPSVRSRPPIRKSRKP